MRLLPADGPRSGAGEPWQLWQWGPVGQPPLQLGPLAVNRASLDLALRSGTLLFTLVHSANLLLISTPAEDLSWAFAWILHPLRRLGLPTTELGSCSCCPCAFCPWCRRNSRICCGPWPPVPFNCANWGFKGGMALLLGLGERLLANLLLRSEQGAQALMARGGQLLPPLTTGTGNTHGALAQWLRPGAAGAVCGAALAGWLVLGALARPPIRMGR